MAEVMHHPYEMHEGSTTIFAIIAHSVGYVAHLGAGLARAAVEGFPELIDPSTSILRRHAPDEMTLPAKQSHLN